MERDVNKEYIAYLTETDFVCGRCNGQALACGKMTTGGCKCCDFHLPIKPRVYYSHSMCLLRDLSSYDIMMGTVR